MPDMALDEIRSIGGTEEQPFPAPWRRRTLAGGLSHQAVVAAGSARRSGSRPGWESLPSAAHADRAHGSWRPPPAIHPPPRTPGCRGRRLPLRDNRENPSRPPASSAPVRRCLPPHLLPAFFSSADRKLGGSMNRRAPTFCWPMQIRLLPPPTRLTAATCGPAAQHRLCYSLRTHTRSAGNCPRHSAILIRGT